MGKSTEPMPLINWQCEELCWWGRQLPKWLQRRMGREPKIHAEVVWLQNDNLMHMLLGMRFCILRGLVVGGTLLVRDSWIQNSDILMNLFLFYEEEKETWRIFQDMYKRVWEPKGECIHLLCGVGLAELAWWRAKGRFLSKCQSKGKFKSSVANQKFNIIFPAYSVVCLIWGFFSGSSLLSLSLFFLAKDLFVELGSWDTVCI